MRICDGKGGECDGWVEWRMTVRIPFIDTDLSEEQQAKKKPKTDLYFFCDICKLHNEHLKLGYSILKIEFITDPADSRPPIPEKPRKRKK